MHRLTRRFAPPPGPLGVLFDSETPTFVWDATSAFNCRSGFFKPVSVIGVRTLK